MNTGITHERYDAPRHAGIPTPPGDSLESTIAILHPGYRDGSNKLLTLPAYDCGGIHYGTALTICGIITGNAYDTGFFAKSREADPEPRDWDSVLVGSSFYFFASENRLSKYAIFDSFANWSFPESLPLPWQNYTIPSSPEAKAFNGLSAQLQERDRSCRVTLHEDGCEVAHLVPKGETPWFLRNQMMDYVNPGDSQAVDHHRNAILLRADMHHLMDMKAWVPMLKENRFVACTICKPPSQPLSSQFRSLYHNVTLQELKGVSKECMFARIAWTVIPLVRPFLLLRWTRTLEQTAVFDDNGEVQVMSGAQLGDKYNFDSRSQSRPGSRRGSPTKRARSEVEPPTLSGDADNGYSGYNAACCSWKSFDSAYDGSNECDRCEREDWPPRGRKRRRGSEECKDDGVEEFKSNGDNGDDNYFSDFDATAEVQQDVDTDH